MTMSGERCYAIWAPDDSPWSAWAKPVPFSQLDKLGVKARGVQAFDGRLPRFAADTAVIVELDGRDGVRAALALADQGWRPVPLFNATTAPKAVVDLVPVLESLLAGAEALEGITIRPHAPPAFLIDARRMNGKPAPGAYDNRSIVLPQDFPSATMLIARGIRTVVLVQDTAWKPRQDLSHVLLRWQQAGLELRQEPLNGDVEKLVVTAPSLFRKAWHRMIALLGLRRNNVGGFGAAVPEATASGYGGYG